MRLCLCLLAGVVCLGCAQSDVFACNDDADCTLTASRGACEPIGYCSFGDAACPSGRRFGSLAGGGLADECVSQASATETGSSGASSTTTGDVTTMGGTLPSTASGTATTDPAATVTTGTAGETESSSSAGRTATAATDGPTTATDTTGTTTSAGGCETWDFQDGVQPFTPVSSGPDVVFGVQDGELVLVWASGGSADVGFAVTNEIDISASSLEMSLTELPTFSAATAAIQIFDGLGNSYLLGFEDAAVFGTFHILREDKSESIASTLAPADLAGLRIEVTDNSAELFMRLEGGGLVLLGSRTSSEWGAVGEGSMRLFFQVYAPVPAGELVRIAVDDVEACTAPVAP